MSEFRVKGDDLDKPTLVAALLVGQRSYNRAVEQDIPTILMDRTDLAQLIAAASLWLENHPA